MSLNFKLTEIKDYKTVCWREDGKLDTLTEGLIWNMLSIGMTSITDGNAAEVYARSKIIELVQGPIIVNPVGGPRFTLSPDDIITHIGLSTNVSYETRERWAQRIFIGNGDFLKKYGTEFDKRKYNDEMVRFNSPDVSHTSQFAKEFRKHATAAMKEKVV